MGGSSGIRRKLSGAYAMFGRVGGRVVEKFDANDKYLAIFIAESGRVVMCYQISREFECVR